MSAILQALTGHGGDHAEKKSHGSAVHTVTYEDIKVQSVVSTQTHTHSKANTSDAQAKMNALMSKLGNLNVAVSTDFSRGCRLDTPSG